MKESDLYAKSLFFLFLIYFHVSTENYFLEAIKPVPKSGNEYLTFNEKSIGYSLFDFWQWSVSDLLINTTRGRLAEFIVGTAFDINPKKIRSEWELFDIENRNGD